MEKKKSNKRRKIFFPWLFFKIIPKGQGWTWLPPHLMPIYFKNAPAPQGLALHVKHCLDFSFVFSAPLSAWRNLLSASGIFCGGRHQLARHQLGCTGIFWPVEGTSQPVTLLKSKKNPSSALRRRRALCTKALSPIHYCDSMVESLLTLSKPPLIDLLTTLHKKTSLEKVV
jgi:hypothetical protein